MSHHTNDLHQELARLREESQKELQDAWARIEKLQSEGCDADSRLQELEDRVNELRRRKNKTSLTKGDQQAIQRSAPHDSVRDLNGNESCPVEKDGRPRAVDDERPKEGVVRSVLRRLSGKYDGAAPRGSRPSLDRCRSDSDLSRRRRPSRDVHQVNPMNEYDIDTALLEKPGDPRIQILAEDRAFSLQGIRDEWERKVIALETLQRTVAVQQEILEELQDECYQYDAPDRLTRLQHDVDTEQKHAAELEKQLATGMNSLTPLQDRHRSIQSEWYELEDRLADIEGQSVDNDETFRRAIKQIVNSIHKEQSEQLQIKETASGILIQLRQHLSERLPAQVTNRQMEDIERRFRGVVQQEKELANLLAARHSTQQKLFKSLQKTLNTIRKVNSLSGQLVGGEGSEQDRWEPVSVLDQTKREFVASPMELSIDYGGLSMAPVDTIGSEAFLNRLVPILDCNSRHSDIAPETIDSRYAETVEVACQTIFSALRDKLAEQMESQKKMELQLSDTNGEMQQAESDMAHETLRLQSKITTLGTGLTKKDEMVVSLERLLS